MYRKFPVEWVVDRLGVDRRTLEWSANPGYAHHTFDGDVDPLVHVLNNIARGKWTAVTSATSTGKTFAGACAVLYFLENFEPAIVVTTAPKEAQLKLHIWKEIGRLYPKFGRGELTTLNLRMQPPLETWAAIGFVAGVRAEETQASATRAQGFHAENMLVIIEETPGVAEAVLTAFENTCTAPNNVIVAFGNPDSQADTLAKFSTRRHVETVRISAYDHPNVVCDDAAIVPGAQTRAGLERMLSKYGSKEHRLFQSRARGLVPTEGADALITWRWCREAVERGEVRPVPEGEYKALGVDVANSLEGDKAAIARGIGPRLIEVPDFQCPNANDLGRRVHELSKAEGILDENIGVDGVGVGAGAVNELLRLERRVKNIMSGDAPIEIYTEHGHKMQEKFKNLRSQMWWLMRLDLQFGDASGLVLPNDDELFADLCAPTWRIRNGVIVVEAKEDIKKRLGRSPNKGDAAVYWNFARRRRGTVASAMPTDVSPAPEQRTLDKLRDRSYIVTRHRTW